MAQKDFYKTLEVQRTATEQEIKSSYRRLARKYHPDMNQGNSQAEDRFKEINEAYEVLGDPEKRVKYDKFGADWEKYDKAGYDNSSPTPTTAQSPNYNFQGNGGFGDMFDNIFGGPKTRASQAREANPGRETKNGGIKFNTQANMRNPNPPPAAGPDFLRSQSTFSNQAPPPPQSSSYRTGTSSIDSIFTPTPKPNATNGMPSAVPQNPPPPARPVHGEDQEQQIEVTLEEAFQGATRQLQTEVSEACPTCFGSGFFNGYTCNSCGGRTQVIRQRKIEVRIPAGVDDGGKIVVAGEGGPGQSGAPRGDLLLKVYILPHPTFVRKGVDLHTTATVPLYTAVLGGEIVVTSPKGNKFALNVPVESQNGKVFRLSGQGMPLMANPNTRGDLYVKMEVVLPTNLSDTEKLLFTQLKEQRAS